MTTATTYSFQWHGHSEAPILHTTTWMVHDNGNREELRTVATAWPTDRIVRAH
jgi:hypothetical protein